ncbi:hypothetical protein DVQ33_03085 [Yersinia enterocolitica]|nr:hypothetical protein [Yersinia enterocolitica]EKN4933340.1 hypothetical protein [Yersinia enterocolitica]EKN5020139.1 hypothetical protein [Yersinia enterocolitica]EKN5030568.1 hypothetical protein [Yersinia enterocolitica]EKN5042289.1 hypothetical protein [Yersinia enterocolitica]
MCVGYVRYSTRPWASPLRGRCKQRSNRFLTDLSPESLTTVSSSGFSPLPPSCNSNYFGYKLERIERYSQIAHLSLPSGESRVSVG